MPYATEAGFACEVFPEIQEGMTGYYVAYHYEDMLIDSNGDGGLDIHLQIALDESDKITAGASAWDR